MSELSPLSSPHFDQIERYLDNVMSQSQLAEFESQLGGDAQLREDVEQMRIANAEISRALAARFSLPGGHAVAEAPRGAAPPPVAPHPHASWMSWHVATRWYALAAALLLCVGGGWMFQHVQSQSRQRARQLVAYYAEQVQLGLTPQWVCKDDKTFREYTAMRFGTPMSFKTLPAGVALVGWTYVRGPMRTDSNAVLMATRDDAPVFVVVEKRANAASIDTLAHDGSIHIFRKDLADITLYEITPLAGPTLLDVLYEAN